MRLGRFRARRWRLRLAWLGLLTLLLQQVALVAYACPMADPIADAPPPHAMMAGCEGMERPDPAAPALCDQHCLRDHVTSSDTRTLQVPPLALPPLHFALTAALLPPVQAQCYEDIPAYRSDPPPAQRFCSLQI